VDTCLKSNWGRLFEHYEKMNPTAAGWPGV